MRVLVANVPLMFEQIITMALEENGVTLVGSLPSSDGLLDAVDNLQADVVVIGGEDFELPESWTNILRERPKLKLLGVAPGEQQSALCELLDDAAPEQIVDAIKRMGARL